MDTYELRETLVTVKDVSLTFKNDDTGVETLILKPISIEVRDIVRPGYVTGQVIGVLGPSGVGKTQFARILSGLQVPTTGEVMISQKGKLEKVVEGSVGVVFQNYPLFKWRTVLGNLLVALEHSSLNADERKNKAMEFLARFELSDKANLYPAQLSGGQRQRVAIIQELLCNENFMIMDEPFTGLDPLMKDKVCELINKVASLDEKNTIFVVAHDISALVSIADTLWLFGRDRDVSGNVIPGATIKKQYNLIERGLAWHPELSATPAYYEFLNEVKNEFRQL